MLVSRDLAVSVEVSVELLEVLVVVVFVEEVCEVVSVVVFRRRVVVGISPIRNSTPTILVLTNRLPLAVG
jgi:hypothetical protein